MAYTMDIGADGKTVTFFGESPESATEETLKIGDVASFGKTVRLGNTAGRYLSIDNDSIDMYNSSGNSYFKAGFGETVQIAGANIKAPYFTLGDRAKDSKIGAYSLAQGANLVSGGYGSHAEGRFTEANNDHAHAEGEHSKANGRSSHAEGFYGKAEGMYAHAEGEYSTATGNSSHASGVHTVAGSYAQTVIGKYNNQDSANKYAFIVGNGTADDKRSNALTIDWDGNVDANKFRSKQPILWSGAYYMQKDQTVNLSQAVSSQANGIMLIFSAYVDGKAQNYEFTSHYISKAWVAKHSGTPHIFMMGSPTLQYFATKVLRFTNTTITGEDVNKDGTKASSCGVKLTNNRYVLRYVIGV